MPPSQSLRPGFEAGHPPKDARADGRLTVKKAWRTYWQWHGVSYGTFQAGMAAVIAASGTLLLVVPMAWLFSGPDLGIGFPWR